MKKSQCSVCNYTHTGDELPDICPVCNASRDAFRPTTDDGHVENVGKAGTTTLMKSQCTVCGYIHQDEVFPENCPVCGVEHDHFSKMSGSSDTPLTEKAGDSAVEKRWRCQVCGYIHIGPSPPAKCPVCGADRSMFTLIPADKGEIAPESVDSFSDKAKAVSIQSVTGLSPVEPELKSSRFSKIYPFIARTMATQHAHPISVHIPNGVLPVAFLFLLLGMVFENDGLLLAAHYNLIFVMISMPFILFSGYNDWKIRLGGHMSQVIRVKIVCGGTITILSLILVMWRFAQPHVLAPWSSSRLIYVLVFLITLLAAAIAGFFGGKLIQFPSIGSQEE